MLNEALDQRENRNIHEWPHGKGWICVYKIVVVALVTIKMMIIAEQIIILMIITITIVAVTGATIVDICY